MKFSISQDMMFIHLSHFDQSLKEFPEKYLPLFFPNESEYTTCHGYVCPICTTNYFAIIGDTLHYSSDFSLDHFPPESAGGKLKILVCKDCNSTAGHEYDFSLKGKLDLIGFNKRLPLATISTKSEVAGVPGWYHSTMTIMENGETEISLKRNAQKKPTPLDDWLVTAKERSDWSANLTFEPPDEKKVIRALVKAAYLYCFLNFGYEFIYSSNGAFFRKVLNGESEYPIPVPAFWLDHESSVQDDRAIPRGLCFIKSPETWQSLVINLPLELKDSGYRCIAPVLIPNPLDTDFESLIEVQKQIDFNPNQTVSFVPIKNFLRENINNAYTQTWLTVMDEYGKKAT